MTLVLCCLLSTLVASCGSRSGIGRGRIDTLGSVGGVTGGQNGTLLGIGGGGAAGGAVQGGTASCASGPRLFDLPATDLLGPAAAILAVDLNGDGLSDAVAAINGSNALAVLLGNGNGTFAPTTNYPVGAGPIAIASADVNRDGQPDLVSVNQAGSSVSILLGTGNGTFADRSDISIVDRLGGNEPQPVAIAAGDFNHDGWPDLAIADRGIARVSVLLGTGGGAFVEGTAYGVGGTPESIVTGDFDGDGALDLANASRGDGAANVVFGRGDGTFARRVDYVTGVQSRWISAGDFDADGRLDLAVVSDGSGLDEPYLPPNIAVLVGIGGGKFEFSQTHRLNTSDTPLAVGDVDRNGTSDLVVPEELSPDVFRAAEVRIATWLGRRDSTFNLGPANSALLLAERFSLGDFDHDGNLDLVTASSYWGSIENYMWSLNAGSLVVAFGNTKGHFGKSTDLSIPGSTGDLKLNDLNGDGRIDLVTVDLAKNAIVTSLGDGNAKFVAKSSYPNSIGIVPLIGDVNNDEIPDLLVSGEFQVRALLGAGDGTFAVSRDSSPLPNQPGVTSGIRQSVIGDVNNDGKLDIVATVDELVSSSTIINPTRLVVLLGAGDGTFGHDTSWVTSRATKALALADLDDDGRLDLLEASDFPASIAISLGAGDGTFVAASEFALGQLDPVSMALGDLDRDGFLDVVLTGTRQDAGDAILAVLLGMGSGTVRTLSQQELGDTLATSVALSDVNGDGKLDAITGGQGVYVALGTGEGAFACVQHYASGIKVRAFALGDVNGDGRPDIVVPSATDTVTLLLNMGH